MAGRSRTTIYLRGHYLIRLVRAHPGRDLLDLTLDDLLAFLDREDWSAETRKSARAALRGFYSWALDTERIAVDPSRRLPTVPVPIGAPRPAPDDVLRAALDAATDRQRLMILLAAYGGLRVAEIARSHTDDLADGQLRIFGKGGRTRIIPAHPALAAEIVARPPGYLFPSRGSHLTAGCVSVTLKRLLGPGWSAHTLRHRFASRAYAVDRDLRAVQELLGHSKPETTMRYTQVPTGAKQAAVLGVALTI